MRKIWTLLAVLLLLLCGCQKETVTPNWAGETPQTPAESADASGWQAKYDLGVRYLSDGNYEEAVIAFTAAIEIDPKNPEGYLLLADAYMGQGDAEAALRTLHDGQMVEWTPEELSDFDERAHDRIRRAERLREAGKYRLEQRPELRPADTDAIFGAQTAASAYGGFALVRENNSREIATFCIAFANQTIFENMYDRVCAEIQIEPVERCFVYRVENGSEDGLRFSFDPETDKLYALRDGAYTVFGDYLVQIDPDVETSRGSCRLLTVRGTELETLMEDVFDAGCYVHDDVLYLSGAESKADEASPADFRIFRYSLQERKVEFLTDITACSILDVCADRIDYLAPEKTGGAVVLRRYSIRY